MINVRVYKCIITKLFKRDYFIFCEDYVKKSKMRLNLPYFFFQKKVNVGDRFILFDYGERIIIDFSEMENTKYDNRLEVKNIEMDIETIEREEHKMIQEFIKDQNIIEKIGTDLSQLEKFRNLMIKYKKLLDQLDFDVYRIYEVDPIYDILSTLEILDDLIIASGGKKYN